MRESKTGQVSPNSSPSAAVPAWRLAALNWLIFAPIGVQLPFLSLWYASVGFGAESIALIQAVTPIARFASNLAIPPIADKRGGAALLLAACAAGAALFYTLAGFYPTFALVFACIVAASFWQGPMIALGDSMVLREVRRRIVAKERPIDYGAIRGFGSVSVLMLMASGGWIVGLFQPSSMIFAMAMTLGVAIPAILLLAPRSATRPLSPTPVVREKIARPGLVALVVLATSLIQAGHAILYTFGSIAFRAQGYGDGMIGLLWAIGVATEIVLFVFASRSLGGAARAYAFLVVGAATSIVRWSLMAFVLPTWALFLVQATHAGTFAATHLGAVYALTKLVGESRRAQAQGWISGVNALIYAACTYASGFLWEAFGLRAYFGMTALAAAGLLLALIAAARDRSPAD
jgi:MFS transporter, PPP family, 3-phenylpropionic acid transporter